MSTSKAKAKLLPFNAARYLVDDEAIAEYMTAVLETHDTDLLLLALSDVARAQGMAQVAKDAGLGRESLYKALAPGAKPRLETILKVLGLWGLGSPRILREAQVFKTCLNAVLDLKRTH